MKNLLLLCLLLSTTTISKAIKVKIYVGAAVKEDVMVPRYSLKLIICNNQPDTIYIRRDNVDMIFPVVTNDISEIADGRSFLYVNNAANFINDDAQLRKYTVVQDWSSFNQLSNLDIEQQEENNKLLQVSVQGNIFYAIPPEKCFTINSVVQSMPAELFKLHNVDKEDAKDMLVNLVLNVKYYTSRDIDIKSMLLISRDSDDMKTAMLKTRR